MYKLAISVFLNNFDVLSFADDLGIQLKVSYDMQAFVFRQEDVTYLCFNNQNSKDMHNICAAMALYYFFTNSSELEKGVSFYFVIKNEYNRDHHKAYKFAIELLMPKSKFIHLYRSKDIKRYETLYEAFIAPVSSIIQREKELKLLAYHSY